MFRVLDNGKEAKYPESIYSEWHNCDFPTKEEAIAYANNWLGDYGPIPEENTKCDIVLYEYAGFITSDIISIIEIPEKE